MIVRFEAAYLYAYLASVGLWRSAASLPCWVILRQLLEHPSSRSSGASRLRIFASHSARLASDSGSPADLSCRGRSSCSARDCRSIRWLRPGQSSLPVLLGTLAVALLGARLLGRALSIDNDLRTLIGVGTGICGASAIAATDAVISASEADVSYAITTIFTFNVIAVLTFPTIGRLLSLSPHSFGLWAGTAVNDMSSVVAASSIFGRGATSFAVVVKLTGHS